MPRRKRVELARPGDPLITRQGVKIDPILPRSAALYDNLPAPIGSESVSNKFISPTSFRPTRRKNIKDLPAPVNIMNGIAAVFMYTMQGVGDREIAETLGITTYQVDELRNHSAYVECFQTVVDELISANSDAIQARISSYAAKAVDNIMVVAENAEDDGLKLRANQDIADRAGIGAKQLADRKQSQQTTLRIMVIDEEKSVSVNLDIGA